MIFVNKFYLELSEFQCLNCYIDPLPSVRPNVQSIEGINTVY